MPLLPLYEQRTSAAGAMQPYAPQPVQESGAVAQAVGQAGQAVGQFAATEAADKRINGEILRRQTDENAKAWSASAVPDLTIKSDQMLQDMKSSATGDAAGFVPQYLSKVDDMYKAAIAMAPDDQSKKYLTQHSQAMRASFGQQAVQFEATSQRNYRVDLVKKGVDDWSSIVARDPRQFEAAMASTEQTMPDVGPEARSKLLDDAKKRYLLSAAGTAVQNDPHGTLRAINQALNVQTPPAPSPFKVAAQVNDLPTGLQRIIGSVYSQESNAGAVDTSQPNYAGALGPMQVTEPTFNGLKKQGLIPAGADWRNPEDSTAAGIALLKSLYQKFNGDPQKVAAAYYSGEKAVNADGTINDYRDPLNPKAPSTLQYAAQVSARMGRAGAESLQPLQAADVGAAPPLLNVTDLRAPAGSYNPAEWGARPDGSQKGSGFLGVLRRPDGSVSTEISVGVEINGKEMDVPSMVPTLTRGEVETLLSMKDEDEMPEGIVEKAAAYARKRIAEGKPVFAQTGEDKPTKTGVAWIDNMAPETLLHYRQQALTETQRTNATARFGLERAEKDIQAQAQAGIVPRNLPSQDEYVASFGPVEGVIRYKENISSAVLMGQSISALQSASPAERASLVAASAPQPGDGFADRQQRYQSLVRANDAIDKQLKDDPATYVSRNSSRVKAAQDALASLPQNASPEQQRAAVDRYAAESISEQARLGAKVPQLYTDAQASKIALQFQDQKEGGANSAALVDNLQKQWGSYFPTVFRQLQKDDKLPGDVMVIPNMRDAPSKERLARLALVTDKDLKERLAPGDSKDLDAQILTTMEPFWSTLAVQGGGERTYATVKRSTERLAMSYMAGGKSVKDAVNQAYDETVGHGYQFESTYRIPTTEMPSQITQGVQSLRRHLEDVPLTIPAATPGMRPEDARKQYLDAVKTGATFVTNPDETGLLLYVQTERGLAPVRGPAGQISFTWKQLRDEYQTTQGQPFIGYAKR